MDRIFHAIPGCRRKCGVGIVTAIFLPSCPLASASHW